MHRKRKSDRSPHGSYGSDSGSKLVANICLTITYLLRPYFLRLAAGDERKGKTIINQHGGISKIPNVIGFWRLTSGLPSTLTLLARPTSFFLIFFVLQSARSLWPPVYACRPRGHQYCDFSLGQLSFPEHLGLRLSFLPLTP